MDYSSIEVLAEISVGLVGFSGLTVVVGRSHFRHLGVAYRIRGLLYTSSTALLACIAILVNVPLPAASYALGFAILGTLIWSGLSLRKNKEGVRTNPFLTWSLSPLSVLVFVALILAPWRWPQQNLAIYEAAIGFSLLVSLIYFIRLVVSTSSDGDANADDA